ncbi:G-protein coupled receptor moody isoform X2 [Scaptodrosophila lebanonensis]|uniref:G-protein coupled receptor moody isoform X2 n=1 Tax=Drosophila lebanonensis TaxID=7225 RepID=A0A6J2TY71_DROLE|nr:G-protein coupled receptor moody isoform X2 [Scaptodrosophila lebanonensis]
MKDSGEGSGDLGAGYDDSDLIPTADAGDASGFSQSLLTFAAIMTFLIMIVGICGNFLTVVALLKCPKVRNVAAAFIISLCIADLLFCALVLPFQGLRFVQGTWKHGEVLCRLIPFIQYGNIGVSLLCIAMITINRYVMITHHSYYARIYKRHWIAFMIAACWIFSYGMQLPTLLGAWGRFGYDSRLQTCSIMSDRHGHSSKTTLFITAFVIPCLVIIACYAKIFWVVHKSEQRLKRHANNQNSIPNNLRTLPTTPAASAAPSVGEAGISVAPSGNRRVSSDSSSYSTDVPDPQPGAVGKQQTTRVKDQREVRAKRNEWRITKMVLAIFLSFVICYLPITIVKVADKDVEHPSLHIFSYIMLYLSACINPIIYVIMNKQYRKAYKTVVLCKPSQLLLPFGKANGASSAAGIEMERYRVEQQPQPHACIPDVSVHDDGGIVRGCDNGSNPHPVSIDLPRADGKETGRKPHPTIECDSGYAATAAALSHDSCDSQHPKPIEKFHQQSASAQEEQSLLHKQRVQQQQQQQQYQSQLSQQQLVSSWIRDADAEQRQLATAAHHHGGGRHYIGGGGATHNAQSDVDSHPRQRNNIGPSSISTSPSPSTNHTTHLYERRHSEEKPIL